MASKAGRARGGRLGAYWNEWDTFKQDIGRGVIKLSLQVASTVPTPTVGNLALSKSPYSRFGLDANAEYSFPENNED